MANGSSKISNPLTLIAVFAGVSEAIGLGILPHIKDLGEGASNTLVGFVVLFPTALVSVFFVTLYKAPHLLYGPGDWQDEQNFIDLLTQKLEFRVAGELPENGKATYSASEINQKLFSYIGDESDLERKNIAQLSGWLKSEGIDMEPTDFILTGDEGLKQKAIIEFNLEA